MFSPFTLNHGPERNGQHRSHFITLAKSITFQVVSALAYLHDPSRKIAHRDFKPQNVLIDHNGCVKLIDFGVSWQENPDALDCIWPESKGSLYFDVCTGFVSLKFRFRVCRLNIIVYTLNSPEAHIVHQSCFSVQETMTP